METHVIFEYDIHEKVARVARYFKNVECKNSNQIKIIEKIWMRIISFYEVK